MQFGRGLPADLSGGIERLDIALGKELLRLRLRRPRVPGFAILLQRNGKHAHAMAVHGMDVHGGLQTDCRDRGVDRQRGLIRHDDETQRDGRQQNKYECGNNDFQFLVQRSTHSRNVLYQSMLFCGFSTQCPSSGNTSSSDGTLCICNSVYRANP